MGEWATIHGQSEQLRLGSTERQRELLDAYAAPAELARYQVSFREHRAKAAELAQLEADALERAREIDLLAFGLGEIEAVGPEPDEDLRLATEAARLQASDDLRQHAGAAQAVLSGGDDAYNEPGAVGLIGQARKQFERLIELDPSAKGLAERLIEVSLITNDIAADVAGYLADLPSDPVRLEAVTARRAELSGLTRKYGSDITAVLDWADSARDRLARLQGGDARITQLKQEITTLEAELAQLAKGISRARVAAAERLATAVHAELAALAMPHARLEFAVTPLEAFNHNGADRVELLFAANPGSGLAPLAKVASGGELSRVRLALEVVLAGSAVGHTFVFDEVDAGVGGAVGLEIGRRLRRLAKTSQVIVVTHLAQVVAFADNHLVVSKSSDGEVTESDVLPVVGEARAAELARMMAGLGDSAAAQEHAADLLREAERL